MIDIGMSPNCVISDDKSEYHMEHTLIQIVTKIFRGVRYPKRLKHVAKLLLLRGANPNYRMDAASPTCLHFAAASGYV